MKKRLLIIIASLLFGNLGFACVVVQFDTIPIGLIWEYTEKCFDEDTPSKVDMNFFDTPSSMNLNLMWEFNSKNVEIPFHFMTGTSFGFTERGFTIKVPMVIELTLFRFKKTMIELTVDPSFGILFGLMEGVNFYYNPTINITIGRKDRKWFYGGIGIGTSGSYACEYYEGFGKDMYFKAGLGVNLFAGVRF